MTYDGLDRLTQTTSPSAVFNTATYTYDVLDNLATVNVTGGSQARNHTYVYDATTKRLSQVNNTVGGANVANLTYDVQGNLATKGAQSYVFDFGNRLRSVPNKETGYEYDGHGRRVYALTVGSSSILSQYANSGQILYQENNKQSKRIDYIYLGNSLVAYRERPLASSTETFKYQHTDALGSPIAVTDAAKTAIESSEYEPFGQLVNKPLFDGPGYTGHVQDAATGLTYMQQRYYDAGIGRFLSVDPVTAYSNPVGAFNRYWYANDNPYRFTDPDGRVINFAIGFAVGFGVDAGIQFVRSGFNVSAVDWKQSAVSGLAGALTGGIGGALTGAVGSGAITATTANLGTVATGAVAGNLATAATANLTGSELTSTQLAVGTVVGGVTAGIASASSNAAASIPGNLARMSNAPINSPAGVGVTISDTTSKVTGTQSASAAQGAFAGTRDVAVEVGGKLVETQANKRFDD